MNMRVVRVIPIMVWALVLAADAAPTNIQATPRAQTTLGPVEGRLDGGLCLYRNPLRRVPGREASLSRARAQASLDFRLRRDEAGPLCPQVRMSGEVVGSEDCLTLNVWSPPNAKGLPVMVFLHGGATWSAEPLGDKSASTVRG
jgi:para-nitrobenzyl esterase